MDPVYSARDSLVLLKCALYTEEKSTTVAKKKKKKEEEKNAKRESKPHLNVPADVNIEYFHDGSIENDRRPHVVFFL